MHSLPVSHQESLVLTGRYSRGANKGRDMKTNKTTFKLLSAVVLQIFVLWTTGCGFSIPSDLTNTDEKKTATSDTASKATSGRVLKAAWAGIESALQANPSVSKKIQLKGLRSHEEDESEEADNDSDIQPDFDYTCELNYSAEFGSDEETSESMDVTCQANCGSGDGTGTVEVSMSTDGSSTEFAITFDECEIETCSDSAVVSGSGSITISDSCEADFDLNLSIAGEGDLAFDLEVEMAGSGDVCSDVESCGDYAGSILYGDDSLVTEDVCGTMEEDLDDVCGGEEPTDCSSEDSDGCGEEPVAGECSEETVSCSADFECQLFAEDNQSDEYEIDNVECVSGCCEIVEGGNDADWYDQDADDESESEEETEDYGTGYWF